MIVQSRNPQIVKDGRRTVSMRGVATEETTDVSSQTMGALYIRLEGSPKQWEAMKVF